MEAPSRNSPQKLKSTENMPELLAPAGSLEALDAAIGEGADAVYLGLKNFNARLRSANFTYSQFEAALRSLHKMGKKLYVTVNTVFEQREADRMYQLLKYLSAVGPDALIVQDFGVVAMAKSCFPSLKLHASTQMNIASARGVNALSRHGISRVVLARELSLEELQAIRAETNAELEVFVHGALCVSASGLCLFSSYLGGKSANRGMCTQACRRLYHQPDEGNTADTGGYYFSPSDLQLLERIPDLAAAGINSFKIEGRMKSADYAGAVVSAYRLVIDALADGDEGKIRESIEQGQQILAGDFARTKTQFYFNDTDGQKTEIDWLNPQQDGGTGISLGAILKVKGSGSDRRALIRPSAAYFPQVGDSVRLHRGDDSERSSHKLIFAEPELNTDVMNGGCWISIPDGFDLNDRVYLIQTKALSKRNNPVVGRNIPAGHSPGRDKAPLPQISLVSDSSGSSGKKAHTKDPFPEGLYMAVSRTEDLYVLQSSRPARVMLNYSRKTAAYLLSDNKPPLPFRPNDIILVLDPYFPQAAAQQIAEEIEPLFEMGYRQFVLNNLGHFSLFRNCENPALIAGPWLYIFNRWAFSFVAGWSPDAYISPLENNRQNLERTLSFGKAPIKHGDKFADKATANNATKTGTTKNRQSEKQRSTATWSNAERSQFFVPVFAWPPLFHIRANLGQCYDFGAFADNRDEQFSLITELDGSLVIPQTPFSIIDKIPFLKEAGFKRFVVDLSGPVLRKSDYRDLTRAIADASPLPHASRFNWKDGFYQSENKE